MIDNKILIREKYGWKLHKEDGVRLWFCGYLSEKRDIYDVLEFFVSMSKKSTIEIKELSEWVETLIGNFALVVKIDDSWSFSAVDKVCSIPLYEKNNNREYIVSNYAPYFYESNFDTNLQPLLEISMSGYTIGSKTIYKDIYRMSPSECVLHVKGKTYRRYYYNYMPYTGKCSDIKTLKTRCAKVTLSVLKRMIKSIGGRQIVIPLSAGNDSRLVASGLKNLNYNNVLCFSYGRKGNYEVRTGREIANKLGYKWVYIQDDFKSKRLFFKSSIYKKYVDEFESYSSVQNVQDVYEVYKLSLMDIIDNDAVFVNGNTGDFISGGHIPFDVNSCKSKSSLDSIDWSLFLNKHYSVWRSIRTKKNDTLIKRELFKLARARNIFNKDQELYDYAIFECIELIGRQSRFVLNQQRSYEFIGHEWRLPLWDAELLNFWEGVPVEYKVKQKLYKDMLLENNWGGVWKSISVNNKLIRPYALLFARMIVKVIASPLGKKKWHALEKNIFVYWMHPSYARTVEPYFKVLFDRRGQRNTISWLADQFIKRNGYKGVHNISENIKKFIK